MDKIESVSYFRILLIAVSWFFIEEKPQYFLLFFYAADLVSLVDKAILKQDNNTELQKQLRQVADLISTTVLTFSVVRANMVWVDTDEGEDDEKYVPLICLCYSLIFLLDFVSKWFRQYSIYLAGERTEAVSNEIETRMLELAYSRPIDIIMYS